MRCIYLASRIPLSPNYRGGGGSVFYEQLLALAELGHTVTLFHYAREDQRHDFDRFVASDPAWREIQDACDGVEVHRFGYRVSPTTRVVGRIGRLFSHSEVVDPVLRVTALRRLRQTIRGFHPDFIWAQHFGPAQVALLQSHVPVVYSHHDWLYRLRALATGSTPDPHLRSAEERTARRAQVVVSGSAVECEQLRRLGCERVHYLPATFSVAPWPPGEDGSRPPRVVHLGGMGTTASRMGLERLLTTAGTALAAHGVEMRIVGELSAAPPTLVPLLRGAVCTGYVPDLSGELRPYDIHVIPWEYSTGQRTRLPLAFNYGQAVVATRASVACYPEAVDGHNCRLVESVEAMTSVVLELSADRAQRVRLGKTARATFEHAFVRSKLLPRYQAAVESAVSSTRMDSADRGPGYATQHGLELGQVAGGRISA